jgi:hypothetical protein
MLVIQEKWSPSECPRCHKDFSEYEPCDDGYYARAYSLERCPYCGQLIKWSASEDTSTVYEQPATVQEGTVNLTVMPEEEKDTATPMEEKTTER